MYYENLKRGNEVAARSMAQWREQMLGNVTHAVGPSCDCGDNANAMLPLFESFVSIIAHVNGWLAYCYGLALI